MLTSPDFKELLSLFAARKVRFLVVGGYAVMKYTEPRFTKDLDLWIAVDQANAAAVFAALKEFGAPLTGLTPEDFRPEGQIYQMGRAPLRVDILMSVDGVKFDEAWARRVETTIGGVKVPFVAKADLILSKRAAGRAQDLIDLENLEQT
jgi:predicted nucleotidyltransferase